MDPKTIGAEMSTQNNRGGQYPMYVIQTDERRWVESSGDWDERERVEDLDHDALCTSCRGLMDMDTELPEDCDDCDWEAFTHFKLEDQFELMPGIFFTEKAAQKHIDENHYHYYNPRVYGVGAWRNPELIAVQQYLITTSGSDLPSHYR